MSDDPTLTQAELREFTGDPECFIDSSYPNVMYTLGVQHLAERAGAYWLVNTISSILQSDIMQQAIAEHEQLASFQVWRLVVADNASAVLSLHADGDEPLIMELMIPSTKFPLKHVDVWAGFDGEFWTLYLPSEH